eukprot:12676480-Prorocentrum_lima.AAC.1
MSPALVPLDPQGPHPEPEDQAAQGTRAEHDSTLPQAADPPDTTAGRYLGEPQVRDGAAGPPDF